MAQPTLLEAAYRRSRQWPSGEGTKRPKSLLVEAALRERDVAALEKFEVGTHKMVCAPIDCPKLVWGPTNDFESRFVRVQQVKAIEIQNQTSDDIKSQMIMTGSGDVSKFLREDVFEFKAEDGVNKWPLYMKEKVNGAKPVRHSSKDVVKTKATAVEAWPLEIACVQRRERDDEAYGPKEYGCRLSFMKEGLKEMYARLLQTQKSTTPDFFSYTEIVQDVYKKPESTMPGLSYEEIIQDVYENGYNHHRPYKKEESTTPGFSYKEIMEEGLIAKTEWRKLEDLLYDKFVVVAGCTEWGWS
jgi:hypothetical protein